MAVEFHPAEFVDAEQIDTGAKSMWDLPVPESPIRQSGWLFLIHSQLARVWTVAGSMFGLASKVEGPQRLLQREAGCLDPPLRPVTGPRRTRPWWTGR